MQETPPTRVLEARLYELIHPIADLQHDIVLYDRPEVGMCDHSYDALWHAVLRAAARQRREILAKQLTNSIQQPIRALNLQFQRSIRHVPPPTVVKKGKALESGPCTYFRGNLVAWKRQSLVALSSAKAELIACVSGARALLEEMTQKSMELVLYCDNAAVTASMLHLLRQAVHLFHRYSRTEGGSCSPKEVPADPRRRNQWSCHNAPPPPCRVVNNHTDSASGLPVIKARVLAKLDNTQRAPTGCHGQQALGNLAPTKTEGDGQTAGSGPKIYYLGEEVPPIRNGVVNNGHSLTWQRMNCRSKFAKLSRAGGQWRRASRL
eukprot:6492778-Amphidinium_carterae.6